MKCFCNILFLTCRFNQQYYRFMISNLHACFYQYYSLRRLSPPFIRCLYAVSGYKHFLTTINYFRRLYTIFGRICYFRRLYTAFGGHILLLTAFDGYILLLTFIYYLQRLQITFDGYILLLALPFRVLQESKTFLQFPTFVD